MTAEHELAADLAAEAAASPPDKPEAPTLERMQGLAAEVNKIEEQVQVLEIQLKVLTERRNQILSNELIDMMDSTHVENLQVGGRMFKATPYYKAAIPNDNPEPGLNWLEEHKAGDLIKNFVIAEFPRGAEEEAKVAVELMRRRFQMATIERKRTVHWSTLTSWLKELHLSVDPHKIMPPLDIIGGIIGRVVKITKAKE